MQADDQPDHSLNFRSLDNDNQSRPPSLGPATRYNSFNSHFQLSSHSQEKMLLSLPVDYVSPVNNGQRSSLKSQTKKVVKRQTANFDESSLSSLPYSYQDNSNLNSSSASSKEIFPNNRYTYSNIDPAFKARDHPKVDNLPHRDSTKKIHNDADCSFFLPDTLTKEAKKKNIKLDPFISSDQRCEKLLSVVNCDKNAYLCDIDNFESEYLHSSIKDPPRKAIKSEKKYRTDVVDSSASKIYESMSKCSNIKNVVLYPGDKNGERSLIQFLQDMNQYEQEYTNITFDKLDRKQARIRTSMPVSHIYDPLPKFSNDMDTCTSVKESKNRVSNVLYTSPGNHYVDMGDAYSGARHSLLDNNDSMVYEKSEGPSKMLHDNNVKSSRRKNPKVFRRHTTEYREPPHLVLPPLFNDSSDSADKSPITKKDPKNPYPYYALGDAKYKKKSSITSSTSEDNSETLSATLKVRTQAKEWRENKIPKRVDSLTVDRRAYRKNATKSAKIKRRGSLNIIDPSARAQPQLRNAKENDISCSMRSCNNTAKSPMIDARKNPVQISVEDMVQMANCGARNKNGSLCHFISAGNKSYLSVSQVLLDQASPSGDTRAETRTLPRKPHSAADKKVNRKSTHSLVLDSYPDLLSPEEMINKLKENILLKRVDGDFVGTQGVLDNSIRRTNKSHSRQRSHDFEKALVRNNTRAKQEFLTDEQHQINIEPPKPFKNPNSYYLLEKDLGKTSSVQRKDNMDTEDVECRCLGGVHSAKSDHFKHDKVDKEPPDRAGVAYRHFGGASSREELASKESIEDTFDF